MRDITFFPGFWGYEEYILSLFEDEDIKANAFYRNLIGFVMENRTPLFYAISDTSEHFAFSGAYNFETKRERYPNRARECLFWLHDFTHMLFPWSMRSPTAYDCGHDLLNTTEQQFLDLFWHQERVASTETEIFAYYRVPGLREKVFPDEKLWYDVLVETGAPGKPPAAEFAEFRELVQMNDVAGEVALGDHPEILAWLRSWRTLTPRWASRRFRSMAGIRVPWYPWQRCSVEDYEATIEAFSPRSHQAAQDNYERNVLANLATAYAIMGWEGPPVRWRHAYDAIQRLEGAVFFKRGL